MAVKTLRKCAVNIVCNKGTDSNGNLKYAYISIGNLYYYTYDVDKALAVVSALAPCLSKTIIRVEEVAVSSLSVA